MNRPLVDEIAAAVLYEGYILYPYRPSALKNQQRFTFGVVAPRSNPGDAEGGSIRTECLLRAASDAELEVDVRFLHLISRLTASGSSKLARGQDKSGRDTDRDHRWQEGAEQRVPVRARLDDLVCAPIVRSVSLPAERSVAHDAEPDESPAGEACGFQGAVVRERAALDLRIEVTASVIDSHLFRVTVRIVNLTLLQAQADTPRDTTLLHSLVSAHAVLHVDHGEFVSQLDPPEDLREVSSACRNEGVWPVLVGDDADADAVLASPIILYDHPKIAPQSAGDFFDGTEIDEMLVLRILTMTDEEKREMRAGDPRARQLLDRTEGLSEAHMASLHGVLRALPGGGVS